MIKKLAAVHCLSFGGNLGDHKRFNSAAADVVKQLLFLGDLGIRLLVSFNKGFSRKWI